MEDFEEIAHTGGRLAFTADGTTRFTHRNPYACTIVQLMVPVSMKGSRENGETFEDKTDIQVLLISDREGFFGHECKNCRQYFRVKGGASYCPYCESSGTALEFLSPNQWEYVKAYVSAIEKVHVEGEPQEIDLDELVSSLSNNKSPFVYSEMRQQTRTNCTKCKTAFDIFGLYGTCPQCKKRNSLQIFDGRIDLLADRIANPRYLENERSQRETEWEDIVKNCVSEFDGFAKDVLSALKKFPMTTGRYKRAEKISFMRPGTFNESLKAEFDIDLFANVPTDDITFIIRFFGRRHLLMHTSGVVDKEYLDVTSDTTVQLGHRIRVRSIEARRFVDLVRILGRNLFEQFEGITTH